MLKGIFNKKFSKSEQENIDELKQFWLFESFTDDELHLLLPYLYNREYSKNEIIFFQEDPAQCIYLIIEGEVKIYLDIDNMEEDLIHYKKGELFGENAVFNNAHRNYSAISFSNKTKTIVIPQVCLQTIFNTSPSLKGKLFYNVAHNYYDFTRKLVHTYENDQGFFEIKSVFENEEKW